jgi:serine protease AprX
MPDLDAIREPLRSSVVRQPLKAWFVVIRLRPAEAGALEQARDRVRRLVDEAHAARDPEGEAGTGRFRTAPDPNQPYVFAHLQGTSIAKLLDLDAAREDERAIDYIAEDRVAFDPDNLVKTIVSEPLLSQTLDTPHERFRIIIDLNLDYAGTREQAGEAIRQLIAEVSGGQARVTRAGTGTHPYAFTELTGEQIQRLAARDVERAKAQRDHGAPMPPRDPRSVEPWRAIYRIWKDEEVRALINRSVATVKADAAQISFSASGRDIVWAVVDSGISKDHQHFAKRKTLIPPPPIVHLDFTDPAAPAERALVDEYGHGTHVAGIIAGRLDEVHNKDDQRVSGPKILVKTRDADGAITYSEDATVSMSGMAPDCKLVSYKVLDADGKGNVSNIIRALEEIQRINDYGRRILIHGVNLSVGHAFDPKWFACGQSPLCVEVDRLVRSGVVVVIAAGNTGYGYKDVLNSEQVASGMALTINDPGNAELAITVGSTHRDMPHVYGVSYFSSKGPTGDGRLKPDLVAPGERIISCAAGTMKDKAVQASQLKLDAYSYIEDSGTSMAAPHVSGVIAAFLSIRREFIGRPERVKDIFMETATDLRRERSFQGRGLVDLMRAIQSV